MSDSKQQGPTSIDHASMLQVQGPSESDPTPLALALARRAHALQRRSGETVTQLRPIAGRAMPDPKQTQRSLEAFALATRQLLQPELAEAASVVRYRASLGLAATSALAAGAVALACVVAYPMLRGPADLEASSTLASGQSPKSSPFAVPPRKGAAMTVVSNASGAINEPLWLGITVNSPSADASVTISRMPAGAALTAGRRASTSEWRVSAQEISGALIIPPPGFVGVMDLTAELDGSDEAPLASSLIQLIWTSAPRGGSIAAGSAATAPELQQSVLFTGPAAADPTKRDINPRDIADFIRRAKDRLDEGDLHAARLLLLRAAEAHDARAALSLAKTFDPMVSKQFGAAGPDTDPAQARYWYEKARDWGSPEAQRQLEALASYR